MPPHQMSWTFLCTPRSTLHPSQTLFLLALNPGGSLNERYDECPSCEAGNDYLVGNWDSRKWQAGRAPLQLQVQALFREIALGLGPEIDYKTLMHRSLAANYVPFRSPRWTTLPNRDRSLAFAQELWSDILDFVVPRVVISIAVVPYEQLKTIMINKGYSVAADCRDRTGWGRTTFEVARLTRGEQTVMLARLPHLSWYRIFDRHDCRVPIARFVAKLVNALGRRPLTGAPSN